MVTFKSVRMADFLECDTFLENTARQLGTSVLKINNSNSIKCKRMPIDGLQSPQKEIKNNSVPFTGKV